MTQVAKTKKLLLIGMVLVYILVFVTVKILILQGTIKLESIPTAEANATFSTTEVPFLLEPAQIFVDKILKQEDGHINLYTSNKNIQANTREYNSTNSEAASYFLLWNAQALNKREFDLELDFINKHMLHPQEHYLMWRLEPDNKAIQDGSNIASDADLRAIKALIIAEKNWGDKAYTTQINTLTDALENVAITPDYLLAPYGGVSNTAIWRADEIWLSYSDFTVFRELATRRAEPWFSIYNNMKNHTLESQLPIGLYNSKFSKEHYSSLDGEGYSINSLWVMVRAAESGDPELQSSARKALNFYKSSLDKDSKIFSSYNSEGQPITLDDPAWVYALVGRAAIALADEDFSAQLMQALAKKQIQNPKLEWYGAIPEGYQSEQRVGQFTMQESIITMQAYIRAIS